MKKMKKFVIFAVCCLSFASAHAANILITGNACANAVPANAAPAPDVAYQAGVDANGHKVASADLPGSAPPIKAPTDITIPLQLNLQNALHLNNSSLYSPDAVVGTIEYKNGQMTFNGQPVSADAQAQIEAACQDVKQPSGSANPPAASNTLSGKRSKNLLMGE